jgi:hypothetical protein
LVVACANLVDLDSHLVGRKGTAKPIENPTLALTGRDPIALEVSTYSEAAKFEELHGEARAEIEDGAPLLITTALGSALEQCVELIVEIASRHPGEETVFVACENHIGACHAELVERLQERGVDCRATMVNRLCPEREPDETGTKLIVRADPQAEWMIEGEVDSEVLKELDRLSDVSFVADVKPFSMRKLWLVNGGHLALALFARMVKEPSIRAIARSEESQEQLIELHADMIGALPIEWLRTLGDSAAYGKKQLVPMCRTEDSTKRILKRLLRADLRPFLDDANRKLGEPARRYLEAHGQQSFRFEAVFEALHEVLLNLDAYEDVTDLRGRKVRLDASKDKEAVSAYGELLDGAVTPETAAVRITSLDRRLQRHRVIGL